MWYVYLLGSISAAAFFVVAQAKWSTVYPGFPSD